ncbi:unnamed protein product [Arctia plantaginis]|uniref:Uncharacterized protein n=1 Tax=Arctia plantaginis TaxID=874455 RepID=A0A8S1AM98_ARCPL|nr:unnamed protein product [Arctia plantaginis]
MDLVGSLLTFVMFWKLSSSLQCYTCDPKCPVDFNESVRDKYLKNCEHSTMCYKRVSTLDFGNGLTSQYTERGCAAQTQDGEQIKVNRKWIQVQNIYEVYEEGCAVDQSYPERRTHTLACYCRGDGCFWKMVSG